MFLMIYGHPRNYDLAARLGLVMSVFIPLIISWPVSIYIFRQRDQLKKVNKELNFLIRHDPLTSLLSRRIFFKEAGEMLEKCRGEGRTCALFFIDLDHFKRINDSHGHVMGDNVLKLFGEVVSGMLKPNEVAGRLGGEEFCIFAADCDTVEARKRADEILTEYRSRAKTVEGTRIDSTLSIGVALSDSAEDLDDLINQADRKLYAAKKSGRNRYSMTGEESPKVPVAA